MNEVLEAIGANSVPQIMVYNKIDLSGEPPRLLRDVQGRVSRLWCSAATGEGLDLLERALAEFFLHDQVQGWLQFFARDLCVKLGKKLYVFSGRVEMSGVWPGGELQGLAAEEFGKFF